MCDRCRHEDHLQNIQDMLDDGDYSFAEDTLTGIYEWVEREEHITAKQIQAYENIRDSI